MEPRSLAAILDTLDKPVKPGVVNEIINYMKTMPRDNEALVMQCAEHLEKGPTLATTLAVVHALNEGEFLLKNRDEDDPFARLTSEFEQLLSDDGTKKDPAAPALRGEEAAAR